MPPSTTMLYTHAHPPASQRPTWRCAATPPFTSGCGCVTAFVASAVEVANVLLDAGENPPTLLDAHLAVATEGGDPVRRPAAVHPADEDGRPVEMARHADVHVASAAGATWSDIRGAHGRAGANW